MTTTTLCFLIRKNKGINEICLAMKKRGLGEGKWNGVGGKLNQDETLIDALLRETKEEINVDLLEFKEVGKIDFKFPDNPQWRNESHIFIATKWANEPQESEEMSPKWFTYNKIPYSKMWGTDKDWIPMVLTGNKINGNVVFDKNNKVISKKFVKRN